ncbi:hypothetical protein JQS43_25720 [Natronosporangium hydrolyticum]|uniref:Uncharacterized protein n=1 Tax=Natronosporangium hydrolyticum TaxID=2811111 RepID=A0A895YAM1_9ACTN|nr:hypothetical protein [Natronosporangium hydrolyticum]QSB14797.1 hypothetical protein JQS43_25720 [Natronosporangium hydrolyticum]
MTGVSDGRPRWFSRRGYVPTGAVVVTMSLLALGCLAAPVLYLRHQAQQAVAPVDERRGQAEQAVAEQVEDFAAAVAAEGGEDLPDLRIDQLATERDTTVRQIIRDPPGDATLVLVVDSQARYNSLLNHSAVVDACYELVFSPAAAVDAAAEWTVAAVDPCPSTQRRPEPSPAPS